MRVEFDPEQPVSLTLLTSSGATTSSDIRIVSVSGRRMSITADAAIPAGALVKLEWSQYLVLGEVLASQQPARTVGLYIRHTLNKKELEPIRRKWVNPE